MSDKCKAGQRTGRIPRPADGGPDNGVRRETDRSDAVIRRILPDQLIDLLNAARRSPGRRSASTLWRWCRKGLRARNGARVRLQHVRVGGKIYTRQDWLERFWGELADQDASYFDAQASNPSMPAPASSTSSLRTREVGDE